MLFSFWLGIVYITRIQAWPPLPTLLHHGKDSATDSKSDCSADLMKAQVLKQKADEELKQAHDIESRAVEAEAAAKLKEEQAAKALAEATKQIAAAKQAQAQAQAAEARAQAVAHAQQVSQQQQAQQEEAAQRAAEEAARKRVRKYLIYVGLPVGVGLFVIIVAGWACQGKGKHESWMDLDRSYQKQQEEQCSTCTVS